MLSEEALTPICGMYDMRTIKTEPSIVGLYMTRDLEPDIEAMRRRPLIKSWRPGRARYWLNGKEITKKEALVQMEKEKKRE